MSPNRAASRIHASLKAFTPAVSQWFAETFRRPSPAQVKAWPVIRRGENTLLLAPTGSGKTLAAFLCAIDHLLKLGQGGELADGIQVLYVTPLKALGNDIQKNLIEPLSQIHEVAEGELAEIRVAVRTGDTPQSERQRMIRKPPHILITTPESLYLLLGSKRIAPALKTIRTVIVDEIHSLCGNKRGVHLALSLERLEERVDGDLQRVGCSATLNPIDEIATYLVGYGDDGNARPCRVVDAGMRKKLDVRTMAPLPDFLSASNTAMWTSAYELLIEEIRKHRTTLIFCNSRYKAERTALRLAELAGDRIRIAAHHGSMSKEARLSVEDNLKAGELDAIIATSSLELGIDIGEIDLVYQLESAKSVATGLQRIGRAGHLIDRTSKGRVLIFERDELLEGAAICKAMMEGAIDAIQLPRGCLDVLSQQIAGMVAYRDWDESGLLNVVKRAYPYAELSGEDFGNVLGTLTGEHRFEMARPPRPLILRDRSVGRLTATRGSAHVCAMCVGTISDSAEYDVVIEKNKRRVGKVQSEFVDDSLRTGDIFVLGSTNWKVVGKQRSNLLVEEAPGSTPTIPWWTGPVEPRTVEVGTRVGALRREIGERLDNPNLERWLGGEYHLCPDGSNALIEYVREQRMAGGFVPDEKHLLVESWKDELGRANIIIYCPLGIRINRTWGMALSASARVRFKQNWSLTASNDLILLMYSSENRSRIKPVDAEKLIGSVRTENARGLAAKAAEADIAGGSRFREVAVCSLQVIRASRGKRLPLWLQNYRAGELFEACRGVADYPVNTEIRRLSMADSLDIDETLALLERTSVGDVQLSYRQVESPSPFSHSLLVQGMYREEHQMGRERRANLLRLHRKVLQEVLSSEQMAQLLDPRAIERLEKRLLHTSEETRARSADELAQAIRDLGDIPADMAEVDGIVEGDRVVGAKMLSQLVREHRVVAFRMPGNEKSPDRLVSSEFWQQYHDAFGGRSRPVKSVLSPVIRDGEVARLTSRSISATIPERLRKSRKQGTCRRRFVEKYLKCHGPVTLYDIMNHTGWPAKEIEGILNGLVRTGKTARGVYTGDKPRPQWINKANLEEVHRLTMGYLKRELSACMPYEVVDFVTRWQHRHPSTRLEGLDGLREVIRQFQGVEVLQAYLESEVLAKRIEDYEPRWLDQLIASGEVIWRRTDPARVKRGKIALCFRDDAAWLASGRKVTIDVEQWADVDIRKGILAVREFFRESGSVFFDDILKGAGVDEGVALRAVWFLVWCGEVICETYECIRHANFTSTLSACYDLASTPWNILGGTTSADVVIGRLKRKKLDPRLGRWSVTERLSGPGNVLPDDEIAKKWADQLLSRWGIVSRDIAESEVAAPSWSTLAKEFKRLELLGKVSRGYYIESHHGDQYALPDAIELLRDCRARRSDRKELGYLPDEPLFCITNQDPANLYTSSLDIIEERGTALKRTAKSGNVLHRMIVQAGQVVLFAKSWDAQQLVELTQPQLMRCIEHLMANGSGKRGETCFRFWNGYPVDVTPMAPLLWSLGFRYDNKKWMVWPPKKSENTEGKPKGVTPDTFLPYYSQDPPIVYNATWLVSRSSEELRSNLAKLIELLERSLSEDCEFQYGPFGLLATYRGKKVINIYVQKTQANLHITHRGWVPPFILKPESDLRDKALLAKIGERLEATRSAIDGLVNGKTRRR